MVCATHQNLEEKVNNVSFRADLFYRINVFPINVPTLAERVEDIPLLTSFLRSIIYPRDLGYEPSIFKSISLFEKSEKSS